MIRNSFKSVWSLCSTVIERREKGEEGERESKWDINKGKNRRKYMIKFQAEITILKKNNF